MTRKVGGEKITHSLPGWTRKIVAISNGLSHPF